VLAFAREAAGFDDGAMRNANGRIAQAGPSPNTPEAVSRCGQSAANAATGRAAAVDEDNPAWE